MTKVESIYDQKALLYADRYGIVEYSVTGDKMIYYANYPEYLKNKAYTMKVTVNLTTMKETRQHLKNYLKKGNDNLYK